MKNKPYHIEILIYDEETKKSNWVFLKSYKKDKRRNQALAFLIENKNLQYRAAGLL